MTTTFLTRSLGAGMAAVLLAGGSANAATMTFACTARDSGKDVPLTLTYDGDADGTLTVKSADGVMTLKARYTAQDANNWGIDAYGPATVIMPDRAALEACLKAKAQPGDLDDADVVTVLALDCQASVAPSAAPVAVSAEVEISAIDGGLNAFITRKYADTSPVAGGHIELSSVPPPDCVKQ